MREKTTQKLMKKKKNEEEDGGDDLKKIYVRELICPKGDRF